MFLRFVIQDWIHQNIGSLLSSMFEPFTLIFCFYFQKNGHKEDILSIAFCPPNLLATSSYDGEVIIWNMVSGHIFCHLFSPDDPDYISDSRKLLT